MNNKQIEPSSQYHHRHHLPSPEAEEDYEESLLQRLDFEENGVTSITTHVLYEPPKSICFITNFMEKPNLASIFFVDGFKAVTIFHHSSSSFH